MAYDSLIGKTYTTKVSETIQETLFANIRAVTERVLLENVFDRVCIGFSTGTKCVTAKVNRNFLGIFCSYDDVCLRLSKF